MQNDLGSALRDYDTATTVSQRLAALQRLHESLRSLENGNKSRPWSPSWELQTAVSNLFNQPNLDVAIDVNTVSPSSMPTWSIPVLFIAKGTGHRSPQDPRPALDSCPVTMASRFITSKPW